MKRSNLFAIHFFKKLTDQEHKIDDNIPEVFGG